MALPSPAKDYVEQRVGLDAKCITVPSATYLVVSAGSHWKAGIMKGARSGEFDDVPVM